MDNALVGLQAGSSDGYVPLITVTGHSVMLCDRQ